MRFQLISLDGTNLENSIWGKLVNATDIKIIQKTLLRKVFFKSLKISTTRRVVALKGHGLELISQIQSKIMATDHI